MILKKDTNKPKSTCKLNSETNCQSLKCKRYIALLGEKVFKLDAGQLKEEKEKHKKLKCSIKARSVFLFGEDKC